MRDPVKTFREFLRKKNLRCTAERDEIVLALQRTAQHFRIDDLVADLAARGSSASRATVYRSVPLLVEAGLLAIADALPGGEFTYEYVFGRDHHDHLCCLRCHERIEFSERGIELLQIDVARHHGFKLVGHHLDLYGICPKCLALESGGG